MGTSTFPFNLMKGARISRSRLFFIVILCGLGLLAFWGFFGMRKDVEKGDSLVKDQSDITGQSRSDNNVIDNGVRKPDEQILLLPPKVHAVHHAVLLSCSG